MAGICLTLGKRREIERLYNDDMRPSEIAAAVGVTTATIYRGAQAGRDGRARQAFPPGVLGGGGGAGGKALYQEQGPEESREIRSCTNRLKPLE